MTTVRQQIEEKLGSFWDEREISIASDPTSLDDMGAPLDSLTACEAMLDIDVIVGQKVPVEFVIQNGGYESRDQFIQQVTDAVLNHIG